MAVAEDAPQAYMRSVCDIRAAVDISTETKRRADFSSTTEPLSSVLFLLVARLYVL